MANISTYPIGTPAQGDLIPGTQKYTDANGKTENLTRNFTVAQLAEFANSYSLGYTVYTALVTQITTGTPTAVILQDTIGGTITWSRASVGSYKATISGTTYVENKTAVIISTTNASKNISATRKTTTDVALEQKDLANALIDAFDNVTIEIRIYS